ncbi:aromatic ring-hydroxylating dioxygenase subunit alpha [Altererythrobacter sp. H2]|uniref:aromatic ring-hydroxylating oxygenase subunit alpha n=1 Tax=Altererythrobacter sp. H2 TaxID=3108391 RepID=UPI002B4C12BA|nr:aromatic ring-hydroxylating dioxygenase subunit alpha [Altererythrobacter sp. H2]WRK94583.1 aromatic ring-hydroxylating dioxygenase subunit alpha [Altererythrobacter sp. H2]
MTDIKLSWPKNYNEVPKEAFVREDIYAEEVKRIFHGTEWHPVAHESELPNPGDFKTFRLAGVPLLIGRDVEGVVRVFYNACSHRGNQLETAVMGNKTEFECPYHRWLFDSKGDLVGCPNPREFLPGFNKADYPLAQPRFDIYFGLIFVTLSAETEPLLEFLGDSQNCLRELLAGDGRLKLLGYQKVRYDTNWKSYTDNDGYHAPLLHQAFKMLNWQGGKGRQYTATHRGHICFESALSVATGPSVLKDPSLIEFKGQDPAVGSRIVSLFPTFVSTKHLDVINLRFATPIDAETVEVHYAYFAHQDDDEEMVRHRLRQSSNLLGPCGLISMEDASVFHRIHIGNHTPGSAIFQKGVHDPLKLESEFLQNDESGNLPRWEYYRSVMGFERAAA